MTSSAQQNSSNVTEKIRQSRPSCFSQLHTQQRSIHTGCSRLLCCLTSLWCGCGGSLQQPLLCLTIRELLDILRNPVRSLEVYLLVNILLTCHLARSLVFRPAVGLIRAAGYTVVDATSVDEDMTIYTVSVSILTYLCSAYWLGASSDAF